MDTTKMSLNARFIEKENTNGERCKTFELNNPVRHRLHRKIIVMDKQECLFLKIDQISCAEASGAYTYVYLTDGKKMLVCKNIKAFAEKLPQDEFVRVHKSYIINVNAISKYVKSDGGYLVLDNGKNIPVSVRKKHALTGLLENWSI